MEKSATPDDARQAFYRRLPAPAFVSVHGALHLWHTEPLGLLGALQVSTQGATLEDLDILEPATDAMIARADGGERGLIVLDFRDTQHYRPDVRNAWVSWGRELNATARLGGVYIVPPKAPPTLFMMALNVASLTLNLGGIDLRPIDDVVTGLTELGLRVVR